MTGRFVVTAEDVERIAAPMRRELAKWMARRHAPDAAEPVEGSWLEAEFDAMRAAGEDWFAPGPPHADLRLRRPLWPSAEEMMEERRSKHLGRVEDVVHHAIDVATRGHTRNPEQVDYYTRCAFKSWISGVVGWHSDNAVEHQERAYEALYRTAIEILGW